ncbi:catalase family protein [Couchioplanes azureus]|uniref:catalase family protein n=1 Tax=Couchioplanes caeruleus TaxID=56438 RepID=UPI001670C0F2|nr:catalase family protein [Couchioplanes caeruleus]GGQ83017.1 hypothetical protein GCM10010166_61530 [Couchioplanes caeruleus subsp. azureus]
MRFVRYDEYAPHVPADFAEELAQLVGMVAQRTRDSVERQKAGRAVRTAHGKTYGLARAVVTIPEVAPEYAQGIYATPGTFDAVVRYSNGLGHLRADPFLGPACGMGIKMFGVPGRSLLADEPDDATFDYNLINNTTFFCNTVKDYLVIEPLFAQLPDALVSPETRRVWLHDFLTRAGALSPDAWLWDELLSMLSFTSIPRRNLMLYTYWSMGAFRHGDYIAKIRAIPTPASAAGVSHPTVDVAADPEAYRTTLVAELGERAHSFELQAQLCTDVDLMPVENTSREWPERLSPFVTVARIDIPRQDISSDDNLAIADTTSITPWRVREEHRPLGEINRVREEVYRQSSIIRHALNNQPRREPTGGHQLLG